MTGALNVLIQIGPVVLLLGLMVSVALALFGFTRRDADRLRWLGRFVLGQVVVAAVAFFAGTALGIAVFCSSDEAGNLCGLGGVFGSGPLLAGIAMAIFAYGRVRQETAAKR